MPEPEQPALLSGLRPPLIVTCAVLAILNTWTAPPPLIVVDLIVLVCVDSWSHPTAFGGMDRASRGTGAVLP
jgi:hypothetical protein